MRAINLLPKILVICFIGLTACNSGYADEGHESYETAKLTIAETESLFPVQFLKIDGYYRKNLIEKWVLEGNISSTATLANYKDVVLQVNYYSKTNTLLGSEQHTIYEFFTPGKAVNFKLKSFGFKGATKVDMEISDATIIK